MSTVSVRVSRFSSAMSKSTDPPRTLKIVKMTPLPSGRNSG